MQFPGVINLSRTGQSHCISVLRLTDTDANDCVDVTLLINYTSISHLAICSDLMQCAYIISALFLNSRTSVKLISATGTLRFMGYLLYKNNSRSVKSRKYKPICLSATISIFFTHPQTLP